MSPERRECRYRNEPVAQSESFFKIYTHKGCIWECTVGKEPVKIGINAVGFFSCYLILNALSFACPGTTQPPRTGDHRHPQSAPTTRCRPTTGLWTTSTGCSTGERRSRGARRNACPTARRSSTSTMTSTPPWIRTSSVRRALTPERYAITAQAIIKALSHLRKSTRWPWTSIASPTAYSLSSPLHSRYVKRT